MTEQNTFGQLPETRRTKGSDTTHPILNCQSGRNVVRSNLHLFEWKLYLNEGVRNYAVVPPVQK